MQHKSRGKLLTTEKPRNFPLRQNERYHHLFAGLHPCTLFLYINRLKNAELAEENDPPSLHPNLSKVTLRPWRAKEFALMDKQLGIVIQQW